VDVAEFRALILDKRLLLLFDYWQRIRGDRAMPDWAEIRAEEFAPAVPFVWAWRLDENGAVRLRLAGEAIVEVLELNIRGKTPFDLYAVESAQSIDDRFRKVMGDPTCSFSIGEVGHSGRAVGLGQRLVLPYFDRKVGRRGVLGGSVLDKNDRSADGGSTLYELGGHEYFLGIP